MKRACLQPELSCYRSWESLLLWPNCREYTRLQILQPKHSMSPTMIHAPKRAQPHYLPLVEHPILCERYSARPHVNLEWEEKYVRAISKEFGSDSRNLKTRTLVISRRSSASEHVTLRQRICWANNHSLNGKRPWLRSYRMTWAATEASPFT